MKKRKIRVYMKNKRVHVELLEYRNFLGLFHWWGVKLHREGTMKDVSHHVYAWKREFDVTEENVVEEF